ncbi:hypothetical protein DFH06DRAFT_1144154 [Mycena polygramma]|nr:hypothetical protein DFH06DRAFT_1144154 [Mycena polygramma]
MSLDDISASLLRFPELQALSYHGLTQFLRFASLARQHITFQLVNNWRPPPVLPAVLETIAAALGAPDTRWVQPAGLLSRILGRWLVVMQNFAFLLQVLRLSDTMSGHCTGHAYAVILFIQLTAMNSGRLNLQRQFGKRVLPPDGDLLGQDHTDTPRLPVASPHWLDRIPVRLQAFETPAVSSRYNCHLRHLHHTKLGENRKHMDVPRTLLQKEIIVARKCRVIAQAKFMPLRVTELVEFQSRLETRKTKLDWAQRKRTDIAAWNEIAPLSPPSLDRVGFSRFLDGKLNTVRNAGYCMKDVPNGLLFRRNIPDPYSESSRLA